MDQNFLAFSHNGCFLCEMPGQVAAGIAISASVGQGGRNVPADVCTIQDALNTATPASSRPIPALVVDGKVGPKTLAAINAYQRRQLGWSDGRVDPNGPTIQALSGGRDTSPPEKQATPGPIPPAATDEENKAFIFTIASLLPTARQWIQKAQRTLDSAIDANTDRGSSPIHVPLGRQEYGLVEKYFHIDPMTRPLRRVYMHDLRRTFLDMDIVISQSIITGGLVGYGSGYFQPDPSDGKPASTKYDAFTSYGGWNARDRSGRPRMSKQDNYAGPNLREDTVFFPTSHYEHRSREYIVCTIIHELAHFVGPSVNSALRITDHSYRSRPDFFKLNAFRAKHTADCYSQFAAEAALGREALPG